MQDEIASYIAQNIYVQVRANTLPADIKSLYLYKYSKHDHISSQELSTDMQDILGNNDPEVI